MAGLQLCVLLCGFVMSTPAVAEATMLSPAMKPLAFLVGSWNGGGAVSDVRGRSVGVSIIGVEADGRVLLRRDHTEVFDKSGQRTQAFSQMMVIYAEGPDIRADYLDGEGHVIHYGPASVVAGRSVEFTSVAQSGAPTFRLRYDAKGADGLEVAFTIRPPGRDGFQPIAIGALHRASH